MAGSFFEFWPAILPPASAEFSGINTPRLCILSNVASWDGPFQRRRVPALKSLSSWVSSCPKKNLVIVYLLSQAYPCLDPCSGDRR